MKVLVIEDDAETGAYILKSLQEQGHVVDLAPNGRDGLFLAAGESYDIMIVDRMLPALPMSSWTIQGWPGCGRPPSAVICWWKVPKCRGLRSWWERTPCTW